ALRGPARRCRRTDRGRATRRTAVRARRRGSAARGPRSGAWSGRARRARVSRAPRPRRSSRLVARCVLPHALGDPGRGGADSGALEKLHGLEAAEGFQAVLGPGREIAQEALVPRGGLLQRRVVLVRPGLQTFEQIPRRRALERPQEGTGGDELAETPLAQRRRRQLGGGGERDSGGARGRLHSLLVRHAERARWRTARGELADQLEAQLRGSSEGDDLEAQLPLADLRRDQGGIARRRSGIGTGGDRDAGEPRLDLAQDAVPLGHRASLAGRLLEEGHGAEEA